ncbi:MAG TPA: ATP-binding protein, partial [Flavisolibacter sp.]|nr:ATP-binding protein [Flavisolibacter sp.]
HLLQTCIDEIRSISKRLSAPTLGEISLPDSIKELVESVNLTNRIEVVYKGQEMSRLKIPQDVHLAIYRIIQEQLNNILKYAEASLVTIHLKKSGANLMLEMTDNGKGFDTSAKRSGIGITNMQTRAENLGGHFQISSTMGKGCKLSVRFPLTVDQETLPQEA